MVFLVNGARVVFAPLIEPLAVAFAVSPTSLGVVATAAWLGSALPRIPTGYLLTRVPRHTVVFGAGLLLAVAAGFTAIAPTLRVLTVGAFLMGISSGVYFIAANPLVSELFPEGVGRALGLHGMASQVAAVLAPVAVGGVLVMGDWRGVFLGLAVLALGATVGAVMAARRTDLPDAGGTDRALIAAVRHQWPLVLAGVAIVGATWFVWNGLFNFYVTYLKAVKGIPEGTARTLLTVMFAAGVPAFVITGRLADRLPNVPLLLAILAGFVGCVALLTVVSGLVGVVVISVAMGYVIHSLFPAADTYLLGTLPDDHRGSAYAVYSGSMMTIGATGSSALGFLVNHGLSFDDAFRVSGVGLTIVFIALLGLYAAGSLPRGHVE